MPLVVAMVKEAEHLIAVSTLEEGAALNRHRLLLSLEYSSIDSKSEGRLLET